jgi:hypothetical protein
VEFVVVTVSVEVPVPLGANVMLEGESVVTGPDGETVDVRVTVPLKPLRLETVIVDVPDIPGARLRLEGLADNLKLPWVVDVTVTSIDAAWEIVPLVPVTVAE